MVYRLIDELICYGIKNQLVDTVDEVYVKNRLLELFELDAYEKSDFDGEVRPVNEILEDLMKVAHEKGIMEEDTITMKDLFDTKIMGMLTPSPSVVQRTFAEKYTESPKEATDYYYAFSQATNYIRKDRIAKDEKWRWKKVASLQKQKKISIFRTVICYFRADMQRIVCVIIWWIDG